MQSSEFLSCMKPSQIPTPDSQYYDQFWENEVEKAKYGLNVNGIHISGWLYWHTQLWKIYIDEFAHALTTLTGQVTQCENYSIHPFALTPFEEKYHTSGHALWRCQLKIPN